MAEMRPYNAINANIVVDGRTIQGFQENDMFSYTFSEEKVRVAVDAQGQVGTATNNNHLGEITINLSGTSIDHKFLLDIANSNRRVSIQITSEIEKISGTKAWITKVPDGAFGKEVPKRTYKFKVADLRVEGV
ncbi:phage structural protein [Lactobacillus taiwanensis]|uniref:phage structural protein n=1 Tax=Lactobacillus taiwanensis TaxID=508451 RepID=UPI0025AA114A|nr:phage protein [Lactobacillus taiwanensis]